MCRVSTNHASATAPQSVPSESVLQRKIGYAQCTVKTVCDLASMQSVPFVSDQFFPANYLLTSGPAMSRAKEQICALQFIRNFAPAVHVSSNHLRLHVQNMHKSIICCTVLTNITQFICVTKHIAISSSCLRVLLQQAADSSVQIGTLIISKMLPGCFSRKRNLRTPWSYDSSCSGRKLFTDSSGRVKLSSWTNFSSCI